MKTAWPMMRTCMRLQALPKSEVRWVNFDFASREHDAHEEQVIPDDQSLTPNLRLWNGRAHCLAIEFKD